MSTNSLWLPPMLHTKHTEMFEPERKVTWLELFYDLVYVATLIQLGNSLSEDISWSGFVKFAVLFVPIWWSWTGITFYVNRFVVDDVWHRMLIFVQILFIAILGISVEGAFTALSTQFVLAYVGIRIVLIILYLRARKHVPDARPLINRYAIGFSLAVLVWLASILFPSPYNYVLWGLAMLIDFATPNLPGTRKLYGLLPPHMEHMSERYGLLVIIVLGESFVKIISSGSGLAVTTPVFVLSIFIVILTSSLWWHYFQNIADREIVPTGISVWIYTHLPLTLGLTAFGVSAKKVFLATPGDPVADKYRLLMGCTVALYLVSVALMHLVTEREGETNRRVGAGYRFGAALLALALALIGSGLTPIIFVALTALIVIIPIGIDLVSSSRNLKPAH